MTKVLLVEDEVALSEPLAFLLGREGYDVTVADTGSDALAKFRESEWDLVLLDVMLPVLSGLEVCRAIRATSGVPIIMLTAKDSEVDIVVGLEIGADDYVTKPYSTRELLARMKAAMRRQHDGSRPPSDESGLLRSGHVVVDTDKHSVTVDGIETKMPLKEFELLEYLMSNSGRVLTRGQLIDRVWGSDYFGDTKTLDVHIKRIRSRIERDPAHPKLVVTVRGLGYRFDPEN